MKASFRELTVLREPSDNHGKANDEGKHETNGSNRNISNHVSSTPSGVSKALTESPQDSCLGRGQVRERTSSLLWRRLSEKANTAVN
jgi:hypothetical protein